LPIIPTTKSLLHPKSSVGKKSESARRIEFIQSPHKSDRALLYHIPQQGLIPLAHAHQLLNEGEISRCDVLLDADVWLLRCFDPRDKTPSDYRSTSELIGKSPPFGETGILLRRPGVKGRIRALESDLKVSELVRFCAQRQRLLRKFSWVKRRTHKESRDLREASALLVRLHLFSVQSVHRRDNLFRLPTKSILIGLSDGATMNSQTGLAFPFNHMT
jgi:hypothetical protein